jgi:hypothetical protein
MDSLARSNRFLQVRSTMAKVSMMARPRYMPVAVGNIDWSYSGPHRFLQNPSCVFALLYDSGRFDLTSL